MLRDRQQRRGAAKKIPLSGFASCLLLFFSRKVAEAQRNTKVCKLAHLPRTRY